MRGALVAAVLAATFLCASFAAAVAPGSPAPAIDADDTTGRRFSLAAHRGDVVLVFFAAPGGALTEAMPDRQPHDPAGRPVRRRAERRARAPRAAG